jgi:hypothetical protein
MREETDGGSVSWTPLHIIKFGLLTPRGNVVSYNMLLVVFPCIAVVFCPPHPPPFPHDPILPEKGDREERAHSGTSFYNNVLLCHFLMIFI